MLLKSSAARPTLWGYRVLVKFLNYRGDPLSSFNKFVEVSILSLEQDMKALVALC